MLKIDTIRHNERMSTQDLLLEIEAAVKAGETEFDIAASGQHNIGRFNSGGLVAVKVITDKPEIPYVC